MYKTYMIRITFNIMFILDVRLSSYDITVFIFILFYFLLLYVGRYTINLLFASIKIIV